LSIFLSRQTGVGADKMMFVSRVGDFSFGDNAVSPEDMNSTNTYVRRNNAVEDSYTDDT
jgi:hypothetical protein